MTLFPSAARYLVRAVQWSVFPRRLSACIREKIIVSEGCHEVDRQRRAFYIHCPVRSLLGRAGIGPRRAGWRSFGPTCKRSEEHTSELQSLMRISYAVFCLKKQKSHSTTPSHAPHYKFAHTHTTLR